MKKKLIEVALPLEAINAASAREKSIRHGHPSTLHLWWARRPLAAARAVIFAQMVDDPSANPELFPTEKAQENERQRLFRVLEELVKWENTTNERVLQAARDEIWQSWRRACTENVDHPRAKELFNRYKLPAFRDPFAGGGALPLEAHRLGLEVYASDLNPVAVLINKALIEIPPHFAGKPPINPRVRTNTELFDKTWEGTDGLAEDIRYYGEWIRREAQSRIGHLFPTVEVTTHTAHARPDLKPFVGKKLPVIAWLWARTVKSPNPAFAEVNVPLASSFMLSSKAGKEFFVEPVLRTDDYEFVVRAGKVGLAEARNGTKLARGANFRCVMSNTPISPDYVKSEGRAGRMGAKLFAIVADSGHGRVYLSPTPDAEKATSEIEPSWEPDVDISGSTQYVGVKPYGITKFSELFTPRQLTMLSTFCDLVKESRDEILRDAQGLLGDAAASYADAVALYLGMTVSKIVAYHCTLSIWRADLTKTGRAFGRQAFQMVWDYAECNPFAGAGGDWQGAYQDCAGLLSSLPAFQPGWASQCAAQNVSETDHVVSTDPPYYDNVPYADLSDFYYVWLRRCLQSVFPTLLATVTTPKKDELVAFAYRHSGKEAAEAFFLAGMTEAIGRIATSSHPAFPVTLYYAFRQSEIDTDTGIASTGWETFLDAVIRAGFAISGTWPMRTELSGALKTTRNALASSIILVCHPRPQNAPATTRRDFLNALKGELPMSLKHLQRSNIAPVDLAQAAIGPGMGVYTRFSGVVDAGGKPLTVRDALALINQTLDEVLAEQEGDFESDTRWALSWFEQAGFSDGEYGKAEMLSKAKNTSVGGMVDAGILTSGRGKVRLLRPTELPANWDPEEDIRLTVWEIVHQLIRALEAGGERAAATLAAKIGARAETARELAYRLYAICERKKWAQEAIAYNGLVQSWPEIVRLTSEADAGRKTQPDLFRTNKE